MREERDEESHALCLKVKDGRKHHQCRQHTSKHHVTMSSLFKVTCYAELIFVTINIGTKRPVKFRALHAVSAQITFNTFFICT